jgi:cbb3-type cytochrome oxidase subunit 3
MSVLGFLAFAVLLWLAVIGLCAVLSAFLPRRRVGRVVL